MRARFVEVLDGRRPRPGVAVAPRAGHDRRATGREPRQIRGRHLHAVDGQHARVEKAAVVQKLHGADARRDPLGIPDAHGLQKPAPRSSSRANEFDFLDRFRQMHAAWRKRIAIDRLADRAKYERRHRVRGMGGQTGAHAVGGTERFELAAGMLELRLTGREREILRAGGLVAYAATPASGSRSG